MGDDRPPREQPQRSFETGAAEPQLSKKEQQALAHSRGRICKKRGCTVCAPLRERRRLKKAQRRADAQAHAHANGEPCGRSSCELAVCVAARQATPAATTSADPTTNAPQRDAAQRDSDRTMRRQVDRHRAGLPCGSESCPNEICVDGFALERVRRHRARRPCRSATCDNPICVASRSSR